MAHLTTRQIRELVEIDTTCPGIRAEVQALITRLTSGGVGPKTDDPRIIQTKRLWDKGFGLELGFDSFDAYLATIPEIPEALKAHDGHFPELVLVDARFGIIRTCELLGVDFSDNNQSFEDFDPENARTDKIYWIRAQDGRKNNGESVQNCREQFAEVEFGLTVHEGLALFAQNPEGLRGRGMDLPGSVYCENRDNMAYLFWFNERPGLSWDWDGGGNPGCGSGSRRE